LNKEAWKGNGQKGPEMRALRTSGREIDVKYQIEIERLSKEMRRQQSKGRRN